MTCLSNEHCVSANASRCDTAANKCVPCGGDTDCAHLDGKTACLAGQSIQSNRCVECTSTNDRACEKGDTDFSCNVATNSCTNTAKGSVGPCGACTADSDCAGANTAAPTARCVPVSFQGAPHGAGYCLMRANGTSCTTPFTIKVKAKSLSGALEEDYCGINERVTTCEAVLDMVQSKPCNADSACGGGQGGICWQSAATGAQLCTIICAESSECSELRICTPPDVPYCH